MRQLFKHQVVGAEFLSANRSALLADEMGLGKSATALAALQNLMHEDVAKRCLLVCPSYLLRNWQDEAKLCLHTVYMSAIEGSRSERERSWRNVGKGLYIVGYESLFRDIDIASSIYWDVIVFDEIQRLKTAGSKMSIAFSELRALRRWGLTGTPLENSVDDLINIFAVLDPDLAVMDALAFPSRALSRLQPKVLRREIGSVVSLPPLLHEAVFLRLNDSQSRAYAAATRYSESPIESGVPASFTMELSLLGKLLRICSIDPSTGTGWKISYLLEELPKILPTEKVLIFSAYPNLVLKPLALALKAFSPILISGQTDFAERSALTQKFQTDPCTRLGLVSVKAGGTGLNLTAASRVIHVDAWWTASAKQQADSRAHRIGQKMRVISTVLVTKETVEERLWRIITDKGRESRDILRELQLLENRALSDESIEDEQD